MNGATVARVDIVRTEMKHLAVVRLVAERPYDHARAVFIPFVQSDLSVRNAAIGNAAVRKILPQPQRIRTRIFFGHAVRFHVRLVEHIKPHTVAQIVKRGAIGIMTGAYGVHVGLFHPLQIFYRFFYGGAARGAELVAVHAL